jgi:hypothetical protein
MAARNTHSLDDVLHIGTELTSAIYLSDDIGPFGYLTSVQEVLETIEGYIADLLAQGFTLDAVKVVIGALTRSFNAWEWINRVDDTVGTGILRGVGYGNNEWIAVGDNARMYASPAAELPLDPANNWSQITGHGMTGDLWRAKYGGTTWVIVGAKIYTGTTAGGGWTLRLTPPGSSFLNTVEFGNNEWVAGGNTSGSPYLVTAGSNPTGAWTSRSTANFGSSSSITSIAYGGGLWVALTNSREIITATSPTGTWTNRGAFATAGATGIDLAYGDGMFVIGGLRTPFPSTGHVWVSTNPTAGAWDQYALTGQFGSITDVLFDGHQFIASGLQPSGSPTFSRARVAAAANPRGAWTNHDPTSAFDAPNTITLAHDGRYVLVAVGDDGDSSHAVVEVTYSVSPTTILADAAIKSITTGSFTADADLERNFWAYAAIGREASSSIAADAFIPGHFSLDAHIARKLTLDAFIVGTSKFAFQGSAFQNNPAFQVARAFSANAVLFRAGQTGSFTTNATRRVTVSGSLTANAVTKRAATDTFTAAAFIHGQITVDAAIVGATTFQLSLNSVIVAIQTGSFATDAVIVGLMDTFDESAFQSDAFE